MEGSIFQLRGVWLEEEEYFMMTQERDMISQKTLENTHEWIKLDVAITVLQIKVRFSP